MWLQTLAFRIRIDYICDVTRAIPAVFEYESIVSVYEMTVFEITWGENNHA